MASRIKARSVPRTDLTFDRLQEVLFYEPKTGVFRWLVLPRKGRWKAGITSQEYVIIEIDRKRYRAHRLAWLYMTGKWPRGQIDHINRDRSDNRWRNLREATQSQQNANSRRSYHRNTSGFKGVSFDKINHKWMAQIVVSGRHYWLGRHSKIKDAIRAYKAAAKERFGKFARTTE